jgi:hypothetical protein
LAVTEPAKLAQVAYGLLWAILRRVTVGIMAMAAEEERRMISKRTKDTLAAAKRRGQKLGDDRGVVPTRKARALATEALQARDGSGAHSRLRGVLAEAREGAAADEQDVGGVDLQKFLLRMPAAALRRNGREIASALFGSCCGSCRLRPASRGVPPDTPEPASSRWRVFLGIGFLTSIYFRLAEISVGQLFSQPGDWRRSHGGQIVKPIRTITITTSFARMPSLTALRSGAIFACAPSAQALG